MFKIFGFFASILIFVSSAHADCITTPAVSSVNLIVGGPTVHVTPRDLNNNCVALPPSTITWSPLGSPSIASGVSDATGFVLTGLAPGSVAATLTSSVSNSIAGILQINVSLPLKVGTSSP